MRRPVQFSMTSLSLETWAKMVEFVALCNRNWWQRKISTALWRSWTKIGPSQLRTTIQWEAFSKWTERGIEPGEALGAAPVRIMDLVMWESTIWLSGDAMVYFVAAASVNSGVIRVVTWGAEGAVWVDFGSLGAMGSFWNENLVVSADAALRASKRWSLDISSRARFRSNGRASRSNACLSRSMTWDFSDANSCFVLVSMMRTLSSVR